MDWNALQHKLFAMDPADPAEDIRKMTQMANQPAPEVKTETPHLSESVTNIPEGTMPVDKDYSINDFAKLAGVQLNEAGAVDAFKAGYGNYNKLDALKKSNAAMGDAPVAKATSTTKSAPKAKSDVKMSSSVYSAFLKKHTAQFQVIASDPKKSAEFDKYMKSIPEASKPKMPKNRNPVASHAQKSGAGTHQDQHNKNKPDRKQKYKKDYANESIKTQLWAALNAK